MATSARRGGRLRTAGWPLAHPSRAHGGVAVRARSPLDWRKIRGWPSAHDPSPAGGGLGVLVARVAVRARSLQPTRWPSAQEEPRGRALKGPRSTGAAAGERPYLKGGCLRTICSEPSATQPIARVAVRARTARDEHMPCEERRVAVRARSRQAAGVAVRARSERGWLFAQQRVALCARWPQTGRFRPRGDQDLPAWVSR